MRTLRNILAGLCVAAVAANAQTTDSSTTHSSTNSLTLEECIQAALQHNFDVQITRFAPELARYALSTSYGSYDPLFSFSGQHTFNQSPGGVDPQFGRYPGTLTTADGFNTAFQGVVPWGMSYNLSGNISDRISKLSGVEVDETSSGSISVLQLRQPILKNSWIDSTRLSIVLNKKNLKISELDLLLQIMTTVTAVQEAYYNLIFSEENVKVQTAARDLAKRLLEENKTKVRIGALAPLDEKQAESQVASSEADLLQALGTRDTQQRVLKFLLSDDYSKWEDVVVKPTESLQAVPQAFNKQESWQKGLSQRPDLNQAKLSLEKQGYVVRYQKNQLYPQLDLFGSYGFNAGNTPEYSGAFAQLADGSSAFYSAGAGVSLPLGNTGARYNYKVAKATKEQMTLTLKKLEQTVLVQIENAIAVATTSFERVRATKNASDFAEAALDAEQKKLQNGKSTSFQVLQLQRDLTAARSAEIRALADYNIALSQLALNEGTTLERRKITLDVK
jgi:outer membrane protein TolC